MDLTLMTAGQLEQRIRDLGGEPLRKVSKAKLREQIAALKITIKPDVSGLERELRSQRTPFDRDKRDALRPQPVMLVEQKGKNRFERRHRAQTVRTIDGQRVTYFTTIKKKWRRPPTMVPVSAEELRQARVAAFAPAPRGSSFFRRPVGV